MIVTDPGGYSPIKPDYASAIPGQAPGGHAAAIRDLSPQLRWSR